MPPLLFSSHAIKLQSVFPVCPGSSLVIPLLSPRLLRYESAFSFCRQRARARECRRSLGLDIGDSAFLLPGRIPWANKNRRFRPPTNCRCSSRPQTGTARDPANPEQFIIVLPEDGAMRPSTRRHVPNWAMSARNPAGVLRKSSCISDLVANVYDGEWLVVGRSYQVSLSRYQTNWGRSSSISSVVR